MKKFILEISFLLICLTTNAQVINDTTARAIAYWNKGDKQSYTLTQTKCKLKAITNNQYNNIVEDSTETQYDTISYTSTKCLVDIEIIDSTHDTYTIKWTYHDYSFQSTDSLTSKLYNATIKAIPSSIVIIKTDSLGAFSDIVNWQEISDIARKGVKNITKELTADQDKPTQLIAEGEASKNIETLTSKSVIESRFIDEIKQYYTFFGGEYNVNNAIITNIKVPNIFRSGKEIDASITITLDTICKVEDGSHIYKITYEQIIDPKQLKKEVLNVLKETSSADKKELKRQSKNTDLTNDTYITNVIHDSGWITYSNMITIVNDGDDETNVIKTELEMMD